MNRLADLLDSTLLAYLDVAPWRLRRGIAVRLRLRTEIATIGGRIQFDPIRFGSGADRMIIMFVGRQPSHHHDHHKLK